MLLCCLRLNVEAFCHTLRRRLPPSTNSAAYQWLVSSTRHGPSQLSVLHLPLTTRDGARYWLRITNSAYSTFIRRPRYGGGSRRKIAMTFSVGKLEWCRYPVVKNFEYLFWQNSLRWRTDGRTPHDGIGHACISLRGKNRLEGYNGHWTLLRINPYNFVCLTLLPYLFSEMLRAHFIVQFLGYPVHLNYAEINTIIYMMFRTRHLKSDDHIMAKCSKNRPLRSCLKVVWYWQKIRRRGHVRAPHFAAT